jgi:hypothetical protein
MWANEDKGSNKVHQHLAVTSCRITDYLQLNESRNYVAQNDRTTLMNIIKSVVSVVQN